MVAATFVPVATTVAATTPFAMVQLVTMVAIEDT
jgi:hypothetical protein